MRYLRLQVCSEAGEMLYEKDVEPAALFEHHVRVTVSDLVAAGSILPGQHYTVTIVPRYSGTPRRLASQQVEESPPPSTSWIALSTEGAASPDDHILFLTFDVRVQETDLCCSVDSTILEATHEFVGHGVTPALVRLGVIAAGDYYRPRLYLRDDDLARFDRENIPEMVRRSDELIELVSDVSEPEYPRRDGAYYTAAETVGEIAADDVAVYLRRPTLAALIEAGKQGGHEESGGMLIGDVYRSSTGAGWLVEIADFTVSEDTVASAVALKHTFETWRKNRAAVRSRFPDKRVVGWYHTHLVETTIPDDKGGVGKTRLFFSTHDEFMHRQFFPDPWYLALVIDPEGAVRFFNWRRGEIRACRGYYLLDEEPLQAAPEMG